MIGRNCKLDRVSHNAMKELKANDKLLVNAGKISRFNRLNAM